MGRRPLFKASDVLDAIERLLLRTGIPPTIRELQRALGVASTRTVLRYLEKLEEDGLIERWAGARGIRLRRSGASSTQTVPVPLVGEAPAGPLMLAEENLEGWIRMPRESLKPSRARFFLLRVRGNSMNRARVAGQRIQDKDLVLVRQQPTADNNDVVVALVDGEATIKRFVRGKGYCLLRPDSTGKQHEPIVVDDEFSIQGVVQAVLKEGAELLEA